MPSFTVEIPSVAVQSLRDAVWGMQNGSPNHVVEIRQIECNFAGANTTNQLSKFAMYRISACSGGRPIAVAPCDTSSASLPAQVLARAYQFDIAATQTDYHRGIVDVAGAIGLMNVGGAASPAGVQVARLHGRFGGRGRIFDGADLAGNVEPLVIREGEGVGLFKVQAGLPHSLMVSAVLRNVTSGACYVIPDAIVPVCAPAAGTPSFAIFNGTGSGVVLQVLFMSAVVFGGMPIGQSGVNLPSPIIRYGFVDGFLGPPDQTSFTVVAHDTAKPVPAGITFATGFTATPLGYGQGLPLLWPYDSSGTQASGDMRSISAQQSGGRVFNRAQGSYISDDGTALMVPALFGRPKHYDAGPNCPGIVLRPGDTFAASADEAELDEVSANGLAIFDYRISFVTRALDAALISSGVRIVG